MMPTAAELELYRIARDHLALVRAEYVAVQNAGGFSDSIGNNANAQLRARYQDAIEQFLVARKPTVQPSGSP
jgi:hypothetical protein